MEVLYKAVDGTIFDNEEECSEYEYELMLDKCNAVFFDVNGDKITGELSEKVRDCFYLKVEEKSSIEKLNEIFRYYGYNLDIDDIGLYFYDENYNVWKDFQEKSLEVYEEYSRTFEILRKVERG